MDRGSPLGSSHLRMRADDCDPIREKHYGQRPCAAQTGRTHGRTDQCRSNVQKGLAHQTPYTHAPMRTSSAPPSVDLFVRARTAKAGLWPVDSLWDEKRLS